MILWLRHDHCRWDRWKDHVTIKTIWIEDNIVGTIGVVAIRTICIEVNAVGVKHVAIKTVCIESHAVGTVRIEGSGVPNIILKIIIAVDTIGLSSFLILSGVYHAG